MPLTRAQQGLFRPLVEKAWRTHAQREGISPGDRAAQRHWYERELYLACEVRSSTELSHTRDFEAAMEHFEGIVGDSIYWAMRRYSGQARRIEHVLGNLCRKHNIDHHYMESIARQALQLNPDHPVPPIDQLADADRIIVIRAIKIHVARKARAASAEPPLVSSLP